MNEIQRYRRFKDWDYTKGASLFVTIATEPRRALFGEIAHGEMRYTELGRIVLESLEAIPRYNPGISLFGHVVMPDHVHFNCAIRPGLAEPLRVFGKAIRRFKVYTTKQAKLMGLVRHSLTLSTRETPSGDGWAAPSQIAPGLLWQQGCHDWLCLSRGFIDSTERYIAYNVPKWELMHGADRRLYIHEPLDSARLDAADYWKGVGNLALLATDNPIASLRVSRRVRDIDAVVRRMEGAVAKGYTILSGFISPGERAVLAMLQARKDARFIRMRPSCIPNARFRPESAYIDAFMEERYLEIARGNDEREFGRTACLDLNDEIAKIAASGKGLAVYFTAEGMNILERGAA